MYKLTDTQRKLLATLDENVSEVVEKFENGELSNLGRNHILSMLIPSAIAFSQALPFTLTPQQARDYDDFDVNAGTYEPKNRMEDSTFALLRLIMEWIHELPKDENPEHLLESTAIHMQMMIEEVVADDRLDMDERTPRYRGGETEYCDSVPL